MSQRFHLIIEYDGGAYVGWQRQDNGPSIQEALETAVFKFSGEKQHVQGAGRTDAGVHARAMSAHVDIERACDANRLREALNAHLRGHSIAVLWAEAVSQDFHARFECLGRSYQYRILNRRPEPTFDRPHCWHVKAPLDHEAMDQAAQILVGKHDFSAFRSVECQAASPIKTLDHLSVVREGQWIKVHAYAISFLHNQVRNLVGTLVNVGNGKFSQADVARILEEKDRHQAGPCAPSAGLYFWRAWYEAAAAPQDASYFAQAPEFGTLSSE